MVPGQLDAIRLFWFCIRQIWCLIPDTIFGIISIEVPSELSRYQKGDVEKLQTTDWLERIATINLNTYANVSYQVSVASCIVFEQLESTISLF